MSRVVWLLDLELGGRTYRLATSTVAVDDADGHAWRYEAGLTTPEVTYSVEDGPSGKSVALECHGPDWPALRLQGVDFALGRAKLRRWKPGQTLEEAEVHAAGPVLDPQWRLANDPFVFTLEAPPWGEGRRVVPESYAITRKTWPTGTDALSPDTFVTDPQVVGALPAVVWGTPGDIYHLGTADTSPAEEAVEGPPISPTVRSFAWAELAEGSPALLAQWTRFAIPMLSSRLVIARHPVVADKVIIWDQSDKRWDEFEVKHGLDNQGQIFAYVDWLPGGKHVRPVLGHEYWCVWLSDYGGGLRGSDGGTLTGLGDLLVWMLAEMGGSVSLARQKAAREVLNRYRTQGVVNTDVTIWDWVKAEILPLFPVGYVEQGEGGYLALRPMRPRKADRVDTLSPRRDGLDVVGDPKQDTSNVANHLVLRYAPGPSGPTKTAVLTDSTSTDRSERYDPWCARSQASRLGRRPRTWTSNVIVEDETAWAVLRDQARWLATPREDVFLETGSDRLDGLRQFDVVGLDAPELGYSDRTCVVEQVALVGDRVRVGLRIAPEEP